MSNGPVIFKRYSDEVAASILNRPEKRNALSVQLLRQLCAHAELVEKDEKMRIWILRANGPVFCAGLDFAEAMDPKLGVESAKMMRQCLLAIYRIPVVTIAMVQGAAMGGGAGLVAACDLAIAGKEASIGFPEVLRGLVPAQVMSVLVRKIRRADIKELLLSGKTIDAERACQMGFFQHAGNLEADAREIISRLLQAAPGALAKTKHLMDRLYSRNFEDDIQLCILHYLQAREEEEAQEGIRAFLDKRKPAWSKNQKLTF